MERTFKLALATVLAADRAMNPVSVYTQRSVESEWKQSFDDRIKRADGHIQSQLARKSPTVVRR